MSHKQQKIVGYVLICDCCENPLSEGSDNMDKYIVFENLADAEKVAKEIGSRSGAKKVELVKI